MLFRLNTASGQPIFLQLMEQIRHAAEAGVLKDGDQLPSIRSLAEELVVSPNTIVKAYTELAREGLVELRQGAGAFVTLDSRTRQMTNRMQAARRKVRGLVERLREEGLQDEEIRRAFESELVYPREVEKKR